MYMYVGYPRIFTQCAVMLLPPFGTVIVISNNAKRVPDCFLPA